MEYFENSLQHLLAELERIDLLIAGQVARTRKLFARDEQFRGLYIPEEEVDALLKQPLGQPLWAKGQAAAGDTTAPLETSRRQINLRKQESLRRGTELRLERMEQLFGLEPLEVDVVLVCLSVELDLRYERLYAYLQDDVTKKRPSVDLVCSLLAPSAAAKFKARACFGAKAPLLDNDLLELIEDSNQSHPPLLAKYLKVNNRIVAYLLGSAELDEKIQPIALLRDPEQSVDDILANNAVKSRLDRFLDNTPAMGANVVHLRGPYGVGRRSTAETLCRERGLRLLVVDIGQLVGQDSSACIKRLRLIHREAKLQQAAVYWQNFDTLLKDQNKVLLQAFLRNFKHWPALTFLAGDIPWEPADQLSGAAFASIHVPRPTFSERLSIWYQALKGYQLDNAEETISAIGTKFKFTGGQILDAAVTAGNLARLQESASEKLSSDDLYQACRLHSNQKLASLARKITPRYTWNDIILPADRLEQLREICNQVKYREQVYGEWGFDRKLSLGKGLSALFAGPSGTGKTMAAEIITKELGLELYKIDLSTVISKYIGETEKNLAQIFCEAETSNAILFFDEADALFGKRSEVKDSHDRYANIETGYLLQRLEEYAGIAILATNLRKNMDDAFVRRIGFTIAFPFPTVANRRRIWESIWPVQTPREPDLDFDYMAHEFEISGGNIKNIVLAAAFLAASDNRPVTNDHLLRAARREYQKMGKVMVHKEYDDRIALNA